MTVTLQLAIRQRASPPHRTRLRGLAIIALASLLACAAHASRLSFTAPGNMPAGHTITADELWAEFDRSLPDGVWISPLQNETYQVVSARWLRRTFLPSLERQMKSVREEGVPADGSAGNCNGFALACRLLLNLSAMSARAPAPAAATLVVRHEKSFGGLPPTYEAHSVAWILTDEGPWIIEVQSATPVALRDYPNRAFIKLVNVH